MVKLKTKYVICRNATIILSIALISLLSYVIVDKTNQKKLGNVLNKMYKDDITIEETENNVTLKGNGEVITFKKAKN